jgi:hypothetical protein
MHRNEFKTLGRMSQFTGDRQAGFFGLVMKDIR